ncbi:hypothetical protein Cch01nite_31910 [Cellulomonas chitinilytica]|uniref:Recombinase domain-containing protein n=1 Tax=Cellulomonas chitinilytica TaxID=398759 RepID=A0A919P358_9CELL|nr:recombinase family protein [Cellulomonas chitinilytica]GIG22467.1 hypothetical protein Cch01nite_31910 [Cellulomonas chitinilytica]
MVTAAYVRISSDPTGQALGVERQESEIRAWAADHGKVVDLVYSDNDLSATTGVRRPGFEALLADRPTEVVVWHQDRLLRVSRDLERVLATEMVVHSVQAGTLDLATPTGRAVARTVAAWSTHETEHKAQRQRAANRQRRLMGLRSGGGQRTFGYTQNGLELIPEEAAAVAEGFAAILAGGSLSHLARTWNTAGLTTTFGNPWASTTIRSVLRNPVYAGLSVYDGEVVARGTWPAIVEEATHVAMTALLSDPARRRNVASDGRRKYLLPSLLTCGVCGASMTTGRSGKGIRTYVCWSTRHLSRAAEAIDEYVTEAVLSRLERVDLPVAGIDADAVRELQTVRDRLDDLAAAYAADRVTLTQLTTATEALRSRQGQLETKLATSHAGSVLHALTGDVRAAWEGLSLDRRRAVITATVETITVTSPGRGARTFRPETVQIVWR